MYDLNLSVDQYHFLMSLTGILCGFILCLFIFLVISKI